MKKNLLMFLFLTSCAISNNKVGNLFLYEDTLKNKNPNLIGELFLKKDKLIFIENNTSTKDDLIQEKVTAIKSKFNQINREGYLKILTFSKPTLSPNGKTIDSENHVFKAIYIDDKDFLENLETEMFYNYHIKMQFCDNENTSHLTIYKDQSLPTSYGNIYLVNKRLNLVMDNKTFFDKDKFFSNKIKKIKLVLEEANKNGYLEIASGGQEFDKNGSSMRWDGTERIYISDDKKFWDILSNYLSLEFQIEVKFNEIQLSK